MSEERQKIQYQLALPAAQRSEAPGTVEGGTESLAAKRGTESPAETERLREEGVERENLKEALRRVKANKGSPGGEGMTVHDLAGYLQQHWPSLREQLLSGTYKPQPVRRVEIPKPDGGRRKLGIPTVLDRLIQQAVMQVLQRRWDRTFSEHSYGFRPRRSAQQAVAPAQEYLAAGYRWGADLDLEKFFDRVHHDKRMGQVAKRGGDKRVLKLIRAFLNAGVMEDGWVSPVDAGTPQGGPLSPLLSNLGLDERDREPKRRIAPKALARFKQRVRELTCRTRGVSLEARVGELRTYLRGWRSYFGFGQTPWGLVPLDAWTRRRLRSAMWKPWKRFGRRVKELHKRGVGRDWAVRIASSGLGPWRLSHEPSICQALPNAFFDALDLPRLAAGS